MLFFLFHEWFVTILQKYSIAFDRNKFSLREFEYKLFPLSKFNLIIKKECINPRKKILIENQKTERKKK